MLNTNCRSKMQILNRKRNQKPYLFLTCCKGLRGVKDMGKGNKMKY